MRSTAGIVAAAVFVAATAVGVAGEPSGIAVAGPRLPLVTRCAAEHPEFHKKWMNAVGQVDPGAFVRLLGEQTPSIQDEERLAARSLVDIYVQAGMSPWVAFAEKQYPGTVVVPSGKLHMMVRANFSTATKDRNRTASIVDLAVKPPFPRLLGESSTGWMPSRTKAGGPVIHGWVDQSLWVKIPDDAEAGPVDVTVLALTEGLQDGSVVRATQQEQYAVRVVPAERPTRENLLCLWAFAVESGTWLAQAEGRTEEARKTRSSHLVWVETLLREFAEQDQGLREAVTALREREEYARNVLSHFEEAEEAPKGDPRP